MADAAAPPKNNPSDFLKTVIGRPVVVKLNSGVDYRGESTHVYIAVYFFLRAAVMNCATILHDFTLDAMFSPF